MNSATTFSDRLETKVAQQLCSQRVGYVLGAGASCLNGNGYPLASDLWNHISPLIRNAERAEIQSKLDEGAEGIEQALDLLDSGSVVENVHRYMVTEAIAQHFLTINPPTDCHQKFVRRLSLRSEISVPLFCLNYDGLIETAADRERVRIVDGFLGQESAYFDPSAFRERFAIPYRARRHVQADWRRGIIQLYKLHGSIGWFQLRDGDVRRLSRQMMTPSESKRLMVPPQHRKAVETTAAPYSALWSDLRSLLCNGPELLHRLVAIGYGLRDEHLNAVIENALARSNFSLLAFACELSPRVFDRWSKKKNAIIVTRRQCSLNGEIGPGHPNLWQFETLCTKV